MAAYAPLLAPSYYVQQMFTFTLGLNGVADGEGKTTTLSGKMKATNSFVKPLKIAPVEGA